MHKLVNGSCDFLALGAFSSEFPDHGPARGEDAEAEQDGSHQQSCFTSPEQVPPSLVIRDSELSSHGACS
jgi:hypothetical protein